MKNTYIINKKISLHSANINITKIIVFLLTLSYFKLKKTIKMLLGYYGVKYSIEIIIEALGQLDFENTITGHAITVGREFYSEYFNEIKLIGNIIYEISSFIFLNSVIKYLPSFVSTVFTVMRNLKISNIIRKIALHINKFIRNLIRIYCY